MTTTTRTAILSSLTVAYELSPDTTEHLGAEARDAAADEQPRLVEPAAQHDARQRFDDSDGK